MAILVTTNDEIKELKHKYKIQIENIADAIGCSTSEVLLNSKSEYFIVAYSKKSKKVNDCATMFVGTPICGDALFMSGSELAVTAKSKPHINEMNSFLDQNGFDEVMIKGFSNAIKTVSDAYHINANDILKITPSEKQVIYLDFVKIWEEMHHEEHEEMTEMQIPMMQTQQKPKVTPEDYDNIMRSAYKAIEEAEGVIYAEDFVLIDGNEKVIKLDPKLAHDTICYMLQYFIDKEEYEKCAVLRDVKFV